MNKKRIGLYRKYDVRRTDGSDGPDGKHYQCCYYVLDLTHDPHALPALAAYANSCEADYPMLAHDLRGVVEGNPLMPYKTQIERPELAPAAHQERTEPPVTLMEFRRELLDKFSVILGGRNGTPLGRAIAQQQCLDFLSELYQRALGAPARAAEWQPLLREELETHGWDNPDSNYCWWCQYDVNGTDGPKHPHGANCWGVRASALLALPPGALAGDSNSKT